MTDDAHTNRADTERTREASAQRHCVAKELNHGSAYARNGDDSCQKELIDGSVRDRWELAERYPLRRKPLLHSFILVASGNVSSRPPPSYVDHI